MAGGECCDDAGRTVLRKVRLDAEFSYSVLTGPMHTVSWTQSKWPTHKTRQIHTVSWHGYGQYHGCTQRPEHIQHCLTSPSAFE
jgi:hypothetical protein